MNSARFLSKYFLLFVLCLICTGIPVMAEESSRRLAGPRKPKDMLAQAQTGSQSDEREKAPEQSKKEPLPIRQKGTIRINSSPGQIVFDADQPSPKPGVSSADNTPPAEVQSSGQVDFMFAPIPFSNPTTGFGLAIVAGFIYPLSKTDHVSPPSVTYLGGAYSQNKSWGTAIIQHFYLKEDHYRVKAVVGMGRLNWDYYHPGTDTEQQDLSLALTMNGNAVSGEFLFRLLPHLYLGPAVEYQSVDTSIKFDREIPSEAQPIVNQIIDQISEALKARVVNLGFHLQYDSRNNIFYPQTGQLLDIQGAFYNSRWGSDFDYEVYQAAYNRYHQIGSRQVLAWRVYSRYASSSSPFFALSFMGRGADLRGYPFGKYQDQLLLDGQAEYRLEAWGRLGLVFFGGVGGVGATFSDLDSKGILASGGCGVRFRLSKTNPLNLRIDLAFTRDGSSVLLSIGEAF